MVSITGIGDSGDSEFELQTVCHAVLVREVLYATRSERACTDNLVALKHLAALSSELEREGDVVCGISLIP